MDKSIVITGASSGFGALTARTLARAGHTVYAGIRHTGGRNAPRVTEAADYAAEHGVDLRTVPHRPGRPLAPSRNRPVRSGGMPTRCVTRPVLAAHHCGNAAPHRNGRRVQRRSLHRVVVPRNGAGQPTSAGWQWS